MEKTAFRAMGTDVEFIIDKPMEWDETELRTVIERAKGRMMALEARLSRFREDSEVTRINGTLGDWTPVSKDTMDILLLADKAFHKTGGFFNPFVGHILETLGYKVTFEHIEEAMSETFAFSAPFIPPMHSPLQLDENALRVRLEPGYQVDLGGIAKGWIVEQTADVLMQHGLSNFVCNAGGDLVCRGEHDGAPWVVGIADPFDPSKTVINLDVMNMCVATSGTYRRTWRLGDTQVHHIIDPFLGEPVHTDIVSSTVMHPSLVEAEVLAKVALILGTQKGIPWLRNQPLNRFVIINQHGEVEIHATDE